MLNLILWIFLAFAFGLILFFSIQDKIPDELYFLKDKGVDKVHGAAQGPAGTAAVGYEGWTVRQGGSVVELTKPLAPVAAGDQSNGAASRNRAPTIGILCDNGRLDVRIDTAGPTTGMRQTPVRMSVNGGGDWDKSQSTNIFPKDPYVVARALQSQESVTIELSYVDAGLVRTTLATRGLPQLMQRLPASCQ